MVGEVMAFNFVIIFVGGFWFLFFVAKFFNLDKIYVDKYNINIKLLYSLMALASLIFTGVIYLIYRWYEYIVYFLI